MTSRRLAPNMAKKQRGKTASASSSIKTAGSEKATDGFNLVLESSDDNDDAPEEVSFKDSKAEALRSVRAALDTARREEELLKEKRRKRQELFQEQKKRKLLPADVLEEIDSAPSKKQKEPGDEAEEEEEDEEEEEEGEKTKKKRKLARARNMKGNYTVMTTAKQRASASFQQQAAEDFVRSRLYGPESCRTTSNELLSLQNKKGTNKSAAVQFVKKDWASKEKAKAEKMKKRWMHKRQISSC